MSLDKSIGYRQRNGKQGSPLCTKTTGQLGERGVNLEFKFGALTK
jgi:hypothetical protein